MSNSKKTQMSETAKAQCDKFLIVGLGNIDYPRTRHNVGMNVVDYLATSLGVTWTKDRKNCKGFIANFTLPCGTQMILLKPIVPMNDNGSSVVKTVRTFDIKKEEILLIHDDIDKKLGKIVIKQGGSSRGHNGVKSVTNCMRTSDITRLRIGIGRPSRQDEVVDYVLGKFTEEESQVINEATIQSVTIIRDYLKQKYNIDLNSCYDSTNEEE